MIIFYSIVRYSQPSVLGVTLLNSSQSKAYQRCSSRPYGDTKGGTIITSVPDCGGGGENLLLLVAVIVYFWILHSASTRLSYRRSLYVQSMGTLLSHTNEYP